MMKGAKMSYYTKKKSLLKSVMEWVLTILIALILSLFLVSNVASLTQIKEMSMEPTFYENDRVLIYKLGYFFEEPERGDVVILNKSIEEKGIIINIKNEMEDIKDSIVYRFTGNIQKNNLIKRVIGVYGDIVDIRDGNVYINGQLADEVYAKGDTNPGHSISYPLEVPEGSVFVLGDNRENSLDSRDLGFVKVDSIKGKAIYRLFPFRTFGKVD